MKSCKTIFFLLIIFLLGETAHTCFAFFQDSDRKKQLFTEGHWTFEKKGQEEAILLWGDGLEKGEHILMFPAELGGRKVTTLGGGTQNVTSNNKIPGNFVLFPTSLKTISPRAIYDYNETAGWILPQNIAHISGNSFISCQGGTFYVAPESDAQRYAEKTGQAIQLLSAQNSRTFTAVAADHGYIQPNGTYLLPEELVKSNTSKTFHITADRGYKIREVIIDNHSYNFLKGASKQNDIRIPYTFSRESTGISVFFTVDDRDKRTPDKKQASYTAPAILGSAVQKGAVLPADIQTFVPVRGDQTGKYNNTMGISTGAYYTTQEGLYRMIESSQSQDTPQYFSKAEVINAFYKKEGLIFGRDYNLIRLYNYHEDVQFGPHPGPVSLYCTYLYKKVQDSNPLKIAVDAKHINTAALFAQKGTNMSFKNLIADVHTAGVGPSEAGNFFGLGSAIQVDGGESAPRTTPLANKRLHTDTAHVQLLSPEILGPANSIYALASGVIEIEGGNIFSCSSGGHGPYVSSNGQILINTQGTNLLSSAGEVNTDEATLTPLIRPSAQLASMKRDAKGEMQGLFGQHNSDETVIVTGDEAGTALATDTGGGLIVANRVSTMTYGLRCAGVYSIGANESWVYTYNSTLVSALDAGLVSAAGGYIYAFNSDISGVMGLKTRAGGNNNTTETGIHVEHSQISASFDAQKMNDAYDVARPNAWQDSMAKQRRDTQQLNIFLDKANQPSFHPASLQWWFKDKSLTPGYSGGNKFAVIYIENSATPISVKSTRLINRNYQEYGHLSPEELSQGQLPADNLLIAVESGGEGNISFENENSTTRWDLTGSRKETCELQGDFYLAKAHEKSTNPNEGSGSNQLHVSFLNSQWTGTVVTEDTSGIADLHFDKESLWTVTSNTTVRNLNLDSTRCIRADHATTVTVAGTLSIAKQTIKKTTTIGNITFLLNPSALKYIKGSGPFRGMPPRGQGGPDAPGGHGGPGGPPGMMPPPPETGRKTGLRMPPTAEPNLPAQNVKQSEFSS